MARDRLSQARSHGRRRAAFAALAAAVALCHLVATRELGARLALADAALPKRMAVTYVRTLEPAPPAAVAVSPPAPRKPRRVARARREPSPAIVAASAPAVDVAASEPTVVADATEAASEPAASDAESTSAATPPEPVSAASRVADAASAEPASPFAVGASAPAGAAGFEWPEATRVSYILTGNYRGSVEGHAEVEWIRRGPRYQVNVDLAVGPPFAPLISRRATSEGLLTDQGLAPDRYDETTHVLFRAPRSSTIRFWPSSVVLVNNQEVARPAGTQDSASQFVQFTWLFGVRPELLRVGNVFEIPLALPRSLDRWRYDVDSEQVLQTSFGPLATFHLKPRRRQTPKPGEIAVEMWLAPELRFLPVRIRFEQDDRTWVDLMIEKKPELS